MFDASRANSALYEHITPENSAVMFIDLQVGLLAGVKTIDPLLLRNNIMALAKIAMLYHLPVILTTCGSSGPNGPLMHELAVMFPDHEVIDRTMINAWVDPRITNAIRMTGRTRLIMSGISTDVSLTFAAISATSSGYAAYGVLDASGTWSNIIETGAIARMTQAGVIPTNWTAVAAELQSDWTKSTGEGMAQIFVESLGSYGYAIDSYIARGAQEHPAAQGQR